MSGFMAVGDRDAAADSPMLAATHSAPPSAAVTIRCPVFTILSFISCSMNVGGGKRVLEFDCCESPSSQFPSSARPIAVLQCNIDCVELHCNTQCCDAQNFWRQRRFG